MQGVWSGCGDGEQCMTFSDIVVRVWREGVMQGVWPECRVKKQCRVCGWDVKRWSCVGCVVGNWREEVMQGVGSGCEEEEWCRVCGQGVKRWGDSRSVQTEERGTNAKCGQCVKRRSNEGCG